MTVRLVEDSAANFLDHLKQGDQGATAAGVGYQVHFVSATTQPVSGPR